MGNSSFGAGQQVGNEKGWDEAKDYFKEQTGKDFDDVCKKGKIFLVVFEDKTIL